MDNLHHALLVSQELKSYQVVGCLYYGDGLGEWLVQDSADTLPEAIALMEKCLATGKCGACKILFWDGSEWIEIDPEQAAT